MRNYKRKRIGHGNLYVAVDMNSKEVRIGLSTNLYTTQANLERRWEILVSCEFDDAGILDKKIMDVLRSERYNQYQSSKSYKLDSYRVQKLIKLLGAQINHPVSKSYDVCECLNCGDIFEAQYNSSMSFRRFIEILENEMLCDLCSDIPDTLAQLKMRKKQIDSIPNEVKEKRVWRHYQDRNMKEKDRTKIARMEDYVTNKPNICVVCNLIIPTSRKDDYCSEECKKSINDLNSD